MSSTPSSSFSNADTAHQQDQQLFADTLLKIQIQSALAKEQTQNQKSPLPLLAQSCALLDNLPTSIISTTTDPNTTAATSTWTPAQRLLINSLKIDAWSALADACIQSNDLIQAEASLQRLSQLQDAAAGPLSMRSKHKAGKHSRSRAQPLEEIHTIPGSEAIAPVMMSAQPLTSGEVTIEQKQAASNLVETWKKLHQVYLDMGKQDMANNFAKRIDKMTARLQELSLETLLPR